ncbi:hypothetical protein [Nonomuraea roseoviolacea]|uniref:Uncharacterized protein n=1 Tax=Nonomuraea roseoviolacea subsp. carminata TaxID=160689 RepID=A0ABT1KB75_9ACTN|nr:hypothetical protein [Nonomuraea roseoviolacea]MCP2350646.1 hypothetical protein [Nonomuraea roseoviolacea subsp. carminata]
MTDHHIIETFDGSHITRVPHGWAATDHTLIATAELNDLRQRIALARERHPSLDELSQTNAPSGRYCPTCITLAPCDTRQILDGQEPDHA